VGTGPRVICKRGVADRAASLGRCSHES
jgi:hypothetical protein